ncbi:MAG: thymidine kinase [Gammaproteobacteria bacterium]|nr:thymidine kinase [Gammaproteobacteria bacterium]
MAKLYFYYSAMNAGKSTVLLQSSYNYREKGMETLLFTAQVDNRQGIGTIHSRIGLTADAQTFDASVNLFDLTKQYFDTHPSLSCVLVDEAQFLNKDQVLQLTDIVDHLNLPVLTYGIRSDFRGEPFEGSLYLLIWADNLIEIKTVCHCGKKAIMTVRVDAQGKMMMEGEQILIGDNDQYVAMCRKHYKAMQGS